MGQLHLDAFHNARSENVSKIDIVVQSIIGNGNNSMCMLIKNLLANHQFCLSEVLLHLFFHRGASW